MREAMDNSISRMMAVSTYRPRTIHSRRRHPRSLTRVSRPRLRSSNSSSNNRDLGVAGRTAACHRCSTTCSSNLRSHRLSQQIE